MKKIILFLSAFLLIGLCGCSHEKGCTVQGSISLPEYKSAYIFKTDRTPLDTIAVTDGAFSAVLADSVAQPYVVIMRFVNPSDSMDFMDMPVVVEPGVVKLELGEYIHSSGTPLNKLVEEFFVELQACKDNIMADTAVAASDVKNIISEFYKQKILANKGNVLGRYIFDYYGRSLSEADREQVKSQLVN